MAWVRAYIYKWGRGVVEIGYATDWENSYSFYAILHREKEKTEEVLWKVVCMQ